MGPTGHVKEFIKEIVNVICCLHLAFVFQKLPTFEMVKFKNYKKFYNSATMSSYFYDDTVDYCIYFLIPFIISLFSMLDSFPFLTLCLSSSQYFVSFSLCELLSTLTLPLYASGWASTLVCGSWVSGSVDCSQLSFSLVDGGCTHNFRKRRITQSRNSVTNYQLY